MNEAAIAKTVAGLGPLRAAVITHNGPPGCWIPTGFDTPWPSSHTSQRVSHLRFVVTSQAAEAMTKDELLASNQRG
jgi:hypothetical protein